MAFPGRGGTRFFPPIETRHATLSLSLFVSISFPTRERKIENFDSLFSFFTPSKINSGEKDGREQCFLGGQPRVFPLPSIFPGFPLGGGSKKREGRDLSLVIARNRRRKFRSLGKKCHRASLHPLGISIQKVSIDYTSIEIFLSSLEN